MTPYASNTGSARNLAALRKHGWRLLLTPANPLPRAGFKYGIDNGAWTAFQRREPFDAEPFVRLVEACGSQADFVVIPDIVAGGDSSLEFSMKWFPRLRHLRTLHGAQFRDADLIVASPPCQFFSRMAMPFKCPWKPEELERRRNLAHDLFWQCWRIQHEACEAAGRYIPMIVENVVGAQRWVGAARWHYGSFYLWGDVPPLMPVAGALKNTGGSWFGQRDGQTLERNDPRDVRKNDAGEFVNASASGGWNHPGKALDGKKNDGTGWRPNGTLQSNNRMVPDGTQFGGTWWNDATNNLIRKASSRSSARKAASAQIAKIPEPLARHIARVFKPHAERRHSAEVSELVGSSK